MRILEIIINIYVKNELLLKKTENMKKVISFNFFSLHT